MSKKAKKQCEGGGLTSAVTEPLVSAYNQYCQLLEAREAAHETKEHLKKAFHSQSRELYGTGDRSEETRDRLRMAVSQSAKNLSEARANLSDIDDQIYELCYSTFFHIQESIVAPKEENNV